VLVLGAFLVLLAVRAAQQEPTEPITTTAAAGHPQGSDPAPRLAVTSSASTPVDTSLLASTSDAASAASAASPAATSPSIAPSSPGEPRVAGPVRDPATDASTGDASYDAAEGDLTQVDDSPSVFLQPRAAEGHRVFVDGRMAGVPPPSLVVPCGRHRVKIGSQGREQTLLVPCGGSLAVAYP
jgi:hypothetical protein